MEIAFFENEKPDFPLEIAFSENEMPDFPLEIALKPLFNP